jgi:hypothetical protein
MHFSSDNKGISNELHSLPSTLHWYIIWYVTSPERYIQQRGIYVILHQLVKYLQKQAAVKMNVLRCIFTPNLITL